MTSWIESIDVNSYVKSLMQREVAQINQVAQNKIGQLNVAEKGLKTQVSAYGQLQNLLNTFQQKITNLSDAFKPSYQFTSSNTSVAVASIDGTPSPGTHTLAVTQLAQAESVASGVFSSNTSPLSMTNTLTFSVGSSNFNISVSPSDNLQNIADNINLGASINNVSVSASVITTGSGQYQLIVSSTQTGTANNVSIAETGTGPNALNISTGVGGTGTVLTQASNAQFTLDGLSFDLASNSNSIAGMNISLLSIGSSTISINASNPIQNASSAISSVVDAYNQAMTFISQAESTSTLPDSTLLQVQSSLKNSMLNSPTLVNLGIVPTPWDQVQQINVTQADGSPLIVYPSGLLTIESDPVTGETLTSKLTANFASIEAQLVGDNGQLSQVSTMLNAGTGSIWKIINDSQYGGITLANNQISKLDDQVSSIQSDANDLRNNLVLKYAQLEMVLSKFQISTQYISQQLESMSMNKGS